MSFSVIVREERIIIVNFFIIMKRVPRARGRIIQLDCSVKFHFFSPQFIDGKPTTNKMAVISYGEHTHPPPPPNKIPQLIKDEIVRAVKAYEVAEATAR